MPGMLSGWGLRLFSLTVRLVAFNPRDKKRMKRPTVKTSIATVNLPEEDQA